MGDEAVRPAPRRSGGCLKWTCGCLAAAVVVGLGLAFLLWHYLNRWDADQSIWENLPPSTTWAVEVHDVQTLAVQAGRDPGVVALLESLIGALNRGLLDEDEWQREFADGFGIYRSFAWLHRAVLPNAFLVGGDHRETGSVFFLVQSPVWLRHALSLTEDEGTVERLDDDETDLFFGTKDGWMVMGTRREVVQQVIDGWDSASKPLGPRPDRRDAYILAAGAPEVPAPVEAPPEPGHFTFADPFAAANAASQTAENPLPAFRFMVVPEKDAWRVQGEAYQSGTWPKESLAEAIPEPAGLRTADYDVAISARFDPGTVELIRTRVSAALRLKPGAPFQDELFWTWLRDGWFASTGDAATFLAAPPKVHDDAYPGMPVTAFGWALREGLSAQAAGERFASLLEDFADSLREDGDPAVVRGMLDAFAVHAEPGGVQGRVELPPVMVSGARLGWRFDDGQGGCGWVGTDASALSNLPAERDLPLADLADSHASMSEAAGAWVVSEAFVDGMGEWLRDRFEMTSTYGDMDEESRRYLRLAGECASRLFVLYPRGAFRLRYDASSGRGGINVRIPHGKTGR